APGVRAVRAGLRGLDPCDGLLPARQLLQHRQEGGVRRAHLLHRGRLRGLRRRARAHARGHAVNAAPTAPTSAADGPVRAGVAAADLQIAGLVPLSSIDWPGQLVATVFCQGCPWRCTYCHNTAILDPRTPGAVSWTQLEQLLARRHGLLDGVVF